MLSDTMISRLNEQIHFEFLSSNLYLQMSAWCDKRGYDGCAAFLAAQSEEELGHMRRLFKYVQETGSMPILKAMEAPPTEFESIGKLFKLVAEHEATITREINKLVSLATKEEDFSTLNFLQWYVAEQHEEEYLFQQILDKIEIIGEEGSGVFFIDQAIGRMAHEK